MRVPMVRKIGAHVCKAVFIDRRLLLARGRPVSEAPDLLRATYEGLLRQFDNHE